ncbi:MAG: phage holin family protein [Synergistaceae bacterium]|nr:phage holin family protein [Synergistaceae bacterium]
MNDPLHEFIIAGFIGLLGWFFGGLDGYVKVLLTFTIADYITGVLAAGVQKKISSETGFNGIKRKAIMFMFVGLANIIDVHILSKPDTFRTAVCVFYIGNEGISIIENADVLGIPIPKFLRGRFLAFAKKRLDEVESETAKNQENSASNTGKTE